MASVFDDYFYLFLLLNNYAYLQRFFAAYTSVYKNILAYTRRKFYYVKMARTGRPTVLTDEVIAGFFKEMTAGLTLKQVVEKINTASDKTRISSF